MGKLDVVTIPDPCDASWSSMTGSATARTCSRCDTTVHDLDAMPPGEAEALLDRPGKLCIRKRVATRWSPLGPARRAAAIAAVAASLAAAGCTPKPRVVETVAAQNPPLPADPTVDDAYRILTAAGWTRGDIEEEAWAVHRAWLKARMAGTYEAPTAGSAEENLHVLLRLVFEQLTAESGVVEMPAPPSDGTWIGRRGK
jgi:hypothetical protein